ncbi:MarR family transcriptional regulator [Gorillibacterium timonense]|uniref:MarR family transcriptional regulator n=1 Tax=Gorillibacterium timonense TaxID=1689269 RepID=UPI00071D598D|nr:MarR family transcriptional regulator [Gorillibacterium timonense]
MDNTKLSQAIDLFKEVLMSGIALILEEISHQNNSCLSKEQFELLTILDKHGPFTPGNLAQMQGVHKSAISNRLNRLLQKDLVEWHQSQEGRDKRFKLIRLTEKGKQQIAHAHEQILRLLSTALVDLDDGRQMDSFIAIMAQVNEKLQRKDKGFGLAHE